MERIVVLVHAVHEVAEECVFEEEEGLDQGGQLWRNGKLAPHVLLRITVSNIDCWPPSQDLEAPLHPFRKRMRWSPSDWAPRPRVPQPTPPPMPQPEPATSSDGVAEVLNSPPSVPVMSVPSPAAYVDYQEPSTSHQRPRPPRQNLRDCDVWAALCYGSESDSGESDHEEGARPSNPSYMRAGLNALLCPEDAEDDDFATDAAFVSSSDPDPSPSATDQPRSDLHLEVFPQLAVLYKLWDSSSASVVGKHPKMFVKVFAVIGFVALASAADLTVGAGVRKLIFDKNITAGPTIWQRVKTVTVNTSNTTNEVISRIVVIDNRLEKDGEAKVIEGGEGHKNVTIELKSPAVFRGLDFTVQVFADEKNNAQVPQHPKITGSKTQQPQLPKDLNVDKTQKAKNGGDIIIGAPKPTVPSTTQANKDDQQKIQTPALVGKDQQTHHQTVPLPYVH
ncbi:hypothetical protein PYW08_010026 [Mythimna loreyi]|uniref:Uncharacterized protein n=1 Tax=Mythimna loreyi TaxID=667449 RepID=A0ACC2Q5G5_9NEOP|nr:hypothetical protein PYW08_010026 [Mythimna loreyi]